MSDEQFIEKYEELLNKGYCDCNEMNCIDNDAPRRILSIIKNLQIENKELSRIIANRVISDYNIDTPLKNQLNDERLKNICLEESINIYRNQQRIFINYLEELIHRIKEKEELLHKNRIPEMYALGKTRGNMIAIDILEEYQKIIGGRTKGIFNDIIF